MDQNLRGLFERALDDEPVPPPGDLARAAMAQGTRLRRRRYLIGGTAAAVSLAVAAAGASAVADPAPPAPAAAGNCATAVAARQPDVSVFLRTDATDAQRAALDVALSRDPRVLTYRYEGREHAFERFQELWRDDPGMTASVAPDSLPESFRIELADPAGYAALRDDLAGLAGVEEIVGGACR